MKLQIILTLDADQPDKIEFRSRHGKNPDGSDNESRYFARKLPEIFDVIQRKVIPEAQEELRKSLSARLEKLSPR